MFGKPSTRELVMQTSQRLDDHVRECTASSGRTAAALKELSDALAKSATERSEQFQKLTSLTWKVMIGIIAGLITAFGAILLPAIHVHLGG